MRRRLPAEREGITHKFEISYTTQDQYGQSVVEKAKGYVIVGLYEDGNVGEIFVKMDRQGSQVSGFIDAWAIAVSMLLQTGTPLEAICDKFRNLSFAPAGMTDNPAIRIARSPIDYIVRWLEWRFLEPEEQDEVTDPGIEVGDLDSGKHLVDVVGEIITKETTAKLRVPQVESIMLDEVADLVGDEGLASLTDTPMEEIDNLIEDNAWMIACDSCVAEEDVRQGKHRWYRAYGETICADCYSAFGPRKCVRCGVDSGLKLIMKRDGAALLWFCVDCHRGYETAFSVEARHEG